MKVGNVNLHVINSKKHRTITTTMFFRKKLKKEMITINNLLFNCLVHSTKKYDTALKFIRRCEELYNNRIYYDSFVVKDDHIMSLTIESLEDKYAEKGNYLESIKLLKEVIFSPNVNNGLFDEKSFKASANKVLRRIKKNKQSDVRTAKNNLLNLIDSKAFFSVGPAGYEKDLNKITRESLYEYYLDFFKKVDIDIYVMGNVDSKEIKKYIEDNFNFENKNLNDELVSYKFKEYQPNIVIKNKKGDQTVLNIAYETRIINSYKDAAIVTIYDIILEKSPSSKFFTNIREKYSLCYYIKMDFYRRSSLGILTSEIKKSSYKKMLRLVEKEMKDMTLGNFSNEEIENAKKLAIFHLEDKKEYFDEYIEYIYMNSLYEKIDIDEAIEKIKSVSKEEIMEFASTIKLHTVYLYGGDKND